MLSTEQISTLRNELEQERNDLTRRLEANDHFDLENEMIKQSLGELSNYDNHPADHGTELFERGKDTALLEHAEEQLEEVVAALEAIERGDYGRCELCDAPIPYERLEALPTAKRCVEHTVSENTSERRPVEEDVIGPFGQFEYDEQDATMYDAEDAWQDVERYGTSDTPSDYEDQIKTDYNEMFIESDEPIGFTEEIESFLMADMEGNFIGISPNGAHEQYEDLLDEEDVMAITGGFGGMPVWDYDQE